jgi:hypothetical protein
MHREREVLLILGVAVLVLAGCGGATQSPMSPSDQGQPHISGQAFPQALAAAPEAVAEAADFHGWKALRLSNGLVTVIAVPAAGGRILSYQLGKHEFLWADASLYGKTLTGATDCGGDRPLPVSDDKTATTAAASGLNAPWTGTVTTARGILAEVTLVSPADKASGLQITRVLRLDAGSTHLQVADTLKNLSDKPVKWSPGTATDAIGAPGGKSPQGQVRAYLPVAAATDHPQGFWSLDGTGLGTLLAGGPVEVTYHGQAGSLAVNDTAGWLALSDATDDSVYARRFTVHTDEDYPGGATAQVAASTYASGAGGYLTLISRGPLQAIAAGSETTFSQDWYATTAPAPIMDTSEMAAINQPLTLKPQGGQVLLQGRLGVFAPGSVLISLLDASGQPVGTPITVAAAPDKALAVDQVLTVVGASTVKLALQNDRGTPLGEIAELPTR